MLRHTTLCAFFVVIMAMGSIYAQGRNGVCGGLSGNEFGLCNAYCEAMDCDGDPKVSEQTCTQVALNFSRATGGGEPNCGPSSAPTGSQLGSCPCNFDVQYWTSFKAQIVKTENATAFTCTWVNSSGPLTLMNLTVDSSSTQDTLTFVATDPVSISGGTCAYDVDFDSEPTSLTTPGGERLVNSEEFPACVSDIAALRDEYLILCGQ